MSAYNTIHPFILFLSYNKPERRFSLSHTHTLHDRLSSHVFLMTHPIAHRIRNQTTNTKTFNELITPEKQHEHTHMQTLDTLMHHCYVE